MISMLANIISIFQSNENQLAYFETIDCGKPIEESRWDMQNAAETFEFFGGTVHNLAGIFLIP